MNGTYRVLGRIGTGAMGVVYSAEHVALPRRFAIKALYGDVAADTLMRMRFANEARAAGRLNHPNVVAVHDYGCPPNAPPFLVMEYVHGVSLSLVAGTAPIEVGRAVSLAGAIARGLGHAHAAGVVHRDLKPGNIRVESAVRGREIPRILDFGIALLNDPSDVRLTTSGIIYGTPLYISPEQASGGPVDGRADLYSLGIVLYELLAGRTPFEAEDGDPIRRHVIEAPVPLQSRNPAVPADLDAIVARLLAKSPDERFATGDEVAAALASVRAVVDRGARPPQRNIDAL